MGIADRLDEVRQRLDGACRSAGRAPGTVSLVAVAKTFPAETVQTVLDAGHADVGESYAQELRDKARVCSGARWHFVGRIQRNKAKYIAPHAWRVHALESVPQAEALVARATSPLHALMMVNIGQEASKGGVAPGEVLARAERLSRVEGLRLCGLTTLPPRTEDPEDAAPFFEELADLAARGRARGLALDELSMGMSRDFHVAVRYGATWVRVGTAIFGPRVR